MSLEVAIRFVISIALALSALPTIAQVSMSRVENMPNDGEAIEDSVCGKTQTSSGALGAMQLVCQHAIADQRPSTAISFETIVIGFVGGFVKSDDPRHPEVLFASYLRKRYGNNVDVKVFSNHDGKAATAYVTRCLDKNHDGITSNEEKRQARIIIYGHSWGATETVALARKLQRLGIPILLTIQLDIISKFGQNPALIPPNVAKAINFYQSKGPLHGRANIVAADPTLTAILGNFHVEYSSRSVNCDNYNWFARTFNKPHHEIENDPLIWIQIAELIDATILPVKVQVAGMGSQNER